MIYAYGLAYRNASYVARSIESLTATATEPVHLTVIENPHPGEDGVEQVCLRALRAGTVQRYVRMIRNVRGTAYLTAYRDVDKPWDEPPPFVVWTDLDLLIPEGHDWVGATRYMMEQQGAAICAHSLSLENYVPPNAGHSQQGFGCWLMGLRRDVLDALPPTAPNGNAWTDAALIPHFGAHGPVKRSDVAPLYHLGWDLWRDDPAYFAEKVAGIPWTQYEPGAVEAVTVKGAH